MEQHASIGIRNNRSQPHIVWLEPWGRDYTLKPGQELVIAVPGTYAAGGRLFDFVELDGSTEVYLVGGGDPQVSVGGCPVECGYNRQAAIDAGLFQD
jgi:hypothetical protein